MKDAQNDIPQKEKIADAIKKIFEDADALL